MPLLELPQPYDFEVSTERFRAFGVDRANLWHEGGLHRVVEGRELRIEPAPGGVSVDPLANGDEPVVLTLLGAPFDLVTFYEFAQADPVLARLTRELAGFRPPLSPDPFEALVGSITAQQLMFAAFAIRSRMIERFGKRAEHAWAFPTRERIAPGLARRSWSRSGSRGGRPSTSSRSPGPTSTSRSSASSPTTRCRRA